MEPSNVDSQKRRRISASGKVSFTFCLNLLASLPSCPKAAGTELSSCVRIFRARTGASPPLVIPMINGLRSTIAGIITVHKCGVSTTLTGRLRAVQSAATPSFTDVRSVAEITKRLSSISDMAYSRKAKPPPLAVTIACNSSLISGATT